MPTREQNDPPVSRGGLWNRLFAHRIEPKSGDPIPGSQSDIHLPEELLSPAWDATRESDTADLTPLASPTEAMVPVKLSDVLQDHARCPQCQSALEVRDSYCKDCGYVLPKTASEPKQPVKRIEPAPSWHERYQPSSPLPSRPSVQRWRATARQLPGQPEVEVYFSMAKSLSILEAENTDDDMVNLQSPLRHLSSAAPVHRSAEAQLWPGARWLHQLISKQPEKLPRIVDFVAEESTEVLVLGMPTGTLLWDAWDHAPTLADRFRWIREIAELLQALHEHQVVFEAIRPEMFLVDSNGHIVLTDLSELLPLPVPASLQMKGALSTAPELILAPELADARVDLYPLGAMLYALHHGRELTDLDFDAYGVPRSFVSIFPDGHPLFTQVILKTFTRYAEARYPSQEEDADQSGFSELIAQLKAGERSAQGLRLDTSGWSSTGLSRATNEDAFALFHATGSEQDRWGDQALVLLADGMGGCNAGEVASSMALAHVRESLFSKPPWDVFPTRNPSVTIPLEEEHVLQVMHEAIQSANAAIHATAEKGDGTQIGMGCTCEVGYLAQGRLFMGHVGDSRAYLYRAGAIRQLTQDQTLVNRMVAMGVLNAEEAATHPRRHELDQALGSSHPVEIQLISEKLQVGDALIFCSDGLTTHVNDRSISEVLRNTHSAEAAARRLVNLANALGGTDNVTVVVARVA